MSPLYEVEMRPAKKPKPPIIVTCLADGLKSLLGSELSPEQAEKIQRVPSCEGDELIGFGDTKGGVKTKRQPSVYNKFIGTCMKSKNIKGFGQAGPAMKECAIDWKKLKPK